ETRTPKDNILPQHVVQNRYAVLKEKYAPWLMANWVETTEPSKHVFEDLGIAAFLCELWGKVYAGPGHGQQEREGKQRKGGKKRFPGFVDVACGNGVLVYILHQEGYEGWGFDARRRKTWAVLPRETQVRLREMIYVPRPFLDAAAAAGAGPDVDSTTADAGAGADAFFDGIFTEETFIISNHADELTLWTPIIGALSRPSPSSSPLPFLAIPCCSHSLSGARHRFPPPKHDKADPSNPQDHSRGDDAEQPAAGDLRTLAAQRAKERADPGVGYSAYASLTAKLVEIAREVGYGADVEKAFTWFNLSCLALSCLASGVGNGFL
ncbi:tRNA(Ser) Um(44) 2'-O-methyltransferase, partial [Ascosphaera atra]